MSFDKRIFAKLAVDAVVLNIAVLVSYFMRLGKNMNIEHVKFYLSMAIWVIGIKLIVFFVMGIYKIMWRYAGLDDFITTFVAVCIANGIIIVVIYLRQLTQVPRSIYLICAVVDYFLVIGVRFSRNIFNRFFNRERFLSNMDVLKRVMVVGAGEAGGILIQEYKKNFVNMKVVCIVDDDNLKKGRRLNGVPVLGNRLDIPYIAIAKKIDLIIIAIPSIKKDDLIAIIEQARKTKCELKIVPSVSQLQRVTGNINDILVKRIRNVDIEDLLGRDEVLLEDKEFGQYLKDKTVLVTGGGGSIGSELCRQICPYKPKKLIVVDIYENNAYDIQNEIIHSFPEIDLEVRIASIRDKKIVFNLFDKCKPDIVFHAAAHKHVPLMEGSPKEAIKNNVFGTLNLVQAANEYETERFVLISTDKAVNPTNVMGATKRLCEFIIRAYSDISKTQFAAVRFGNVLGSNGSVIPLFKKQIEQGGPVTVTAPEIIRYFMTISEAVQLVIEAGGMAKGGEIFILDMGKPVKIDKLARDLITLSGFEPDKDISIVYTGLRPGEKLYEELLMNEENVTHTQNSKICITKPLEIGVFEVDSKIMILKNALEGTNEEVIQALEEVVPTYQRNHI